MGKHIARPMLLGAVLVGALALSACSAGSSGASDGDSGAPSTTPSAVDASPSTPADRVDFGSAPAADGLPRCVDLLPTATVDELVPGAEPVDPATLAHVPGGLWVTRTAGGTSCGVGNGVAQLDEVFPGTKGDPVYQGVQVQVLPDAEPEWTDAQQRSTTPAESATAVTCSASDAARVSCNGGALAGSAWVELSLVRLQDAQDATPEAIEPGFRSLLDHAVSVVEASDAGTRSTTHDTASWKNTACDPTNVNAVANERLVDPISAGSDVPSSLATYAQNRIGGASCAFDVQPDGGYSRTDAVYSEVPDGGWGLEQRLGEGTVDRHDRLELDGLGDGDGAWRTCDETACTVDVVRDGGDWSHWVLFTRAAANTSSAIERWVEASLD